MTVAVKKNPHGHRHAQSCPQDTGKEVFFRSPDQQVRGERKKTMKQTTVTRWSVRQADADTVYIGRPGKWGNPFRIGKDGNRAQVIRKYALWVWEPAQAALRAAARRELKGKKLACFCVPEMCHGHILASVANSTE